MLLYEVDEYQETYGTWIYTIYRHIIRDTGIHIVMHTYTYLCENVNTF